MLGDNQSSMAVTQVAPGDKRQRNTQHADQDSQSGHTQPSLAEGLPSDKDDAL